MTCHVIHGGHRCQSPDGETLQVRSGLHTEAGGRRGREKRGGSSLLHPLLQVSFNPQVLVGLASEELAKGWTQW